MNVTAEVLEWVDKAENDLAAAYLLAEGEPPLPDQLGFFCQQAAEPPPGVQTPGYHR